jgi:hypothetical protein
VDQEASTVTIALAGPGQMLRLTRDAIASLQ